MLGYLKYVSFYSWEISARELNARLGCNRNVWARLNLKDRPSGLSEPVVWSPLLREASWLTSARKAFTASV